MPFLRARANSMLAVSDRGAPSRPRSVNTYRTDTRADDNCRTSTYWLRTNAFLRGVIFCQDVLNTTNGENVFFVGSHPTDIIRPSAKRTSVHRSTSLTVRCVSSFLTVSTCCQMKRRNVHAAISNPDISPFQYPISRILNVVVANIPHFSSLHYVAVPWDCHNDNSV